MTPSSTDPRHIRSSPVSTEEVVDNATVSLQIRVDGAAASSLPESSDRLSPLTTPGVQVSSEAFSLPWMGENFDLGFDLGIELGDVLLTDQRPSTSPRIDSGRASSSPMPPRLPSRSIGFNLACTAGPRGPLSARPYFPSTIREFELNTHPARGSSSGFPQEDERRSFPSLAPHRWASRPEVRRSPSGGHLRRVASETSLSRLQGAGDAPQSPPSLPISRGSPASPVRPLSRNSVSFGPAYPVTSPPPSPSGAPAGLKPGLFFPPDVLFTRCISGELPPEAITRVSGFTKDSFISTTADYEEVGIGVNLPKEGELFTTNDPRQLVEGLALNRESSDSVRRHGLWLLTIGLGAKIAVGINRQSSANQHFVEPPAGSQCGRALDTNFREWVMAEPESFLEDVRRKEGPIQIYRIDTGGRTEQWSFAGTKLMPMSEIEALSTAERNALARATPEVRV